ncbi:MAG: hypothetical protein APF77_17240 [Clostridia bacterium BRH_c25]|nr:MAG: hypothetical protein APF77_17240 [Clostridia bacterium BRH_c25]
MKNVNINISIPSEILLTLRENDVQLALDMKRYTAIKLYQDKRLSVGHSAELAEMTEEDFIRFLGENSISIFDYSNYDSLKEDIANA